MCSGHEGTKIAIFRTFVNSIGITKVHIDGVCGFNAEKESIIIISVIVIITAILLLRDF